MAGPVGIILLDLTEGFSADEYGTPGNHLGVAVFPPGKRVDASGVHVNQISDDILQSRGIQGLSLIHI